MSSPAPRIEVEPVSWGRLFAGPSAQAGIVLVHDVWGPSEHSAELARDLAAEGFDVLEIDLYRTMRTEGAFEIEAPGPLIMQLRDAEILADLDAAGSWLSERGGANFPVGVMGVCMGGTFTLLAACGSSVFSAAAPFYGILSYDEGPIAASAQRDLERKPRSPVEAAGALRMPLLASFGGTDDFVPAAHVESLRSALPEAGPACQIDVYPEAGHAFLNRTREEAYDPSASAAAWSKLVPFFKTHLQGAPR